jgi:hypothetical protein
MIKEWAVLSGGTGTRRTLDHEAQAKRTRTPRSPAWGGCHGNGSGQESMNGVAKGKHRWRVQACSRGVLGDFPRAWHLKDMVGH